MDELQHLDYVLKSPSLGVRTGEYFGTDAMKVVTCRGIDLPGWEPGYRYLSDCGDPQPDPTLSHSNGYNTAYVHPPAYYTLTALAGGGILRLPGVGSALSAYRLVGVVWLMAGLALVWHALSLTGAGVATKAAVVGLLGVSPAVVHGSSMVNPDATSLLGGALVVVALMRWDMGRWPWWLVPIASAAAVALKLTNAAAVGAAAVFVAVRWWQTRSQDPARTRERLLVVSVSGAAVMATIYAWRLWQGHRQLAEERDLAVFGRGRGRVDAFQWAELGEELRATLTPFRDSWVPDNLPRGALIPLAGIADVGLLALLGVTVAVVAAKSRYRALVAGVFTAMLAMGVLTMVTNYSTLSRYFLTPGRYGLAVLPVAAVAVAPTLRRAVVARASVAALAVITGAVMLYGVTAGGTSAVVAAPPDDEDTIAIWCRTTSDSVEWRWNPIPGATTYHVSVDGQEWSPQVATTARVANQPPDAETMLIVQAGGEQGWDSGPRGSRTCRTAPAVGPTVWCVATPNSLVWLWGTVEGATAYRVRNDPAHPWLLAFDARTTKSEGLPLGEHATLYVQAGNDDGWNVDDTGVASCRTV